MGKEPEPKEDEPKQEDPEKVSKKQPSKQAPKEQSEFDKLVNITKATCDNNMALIIECFEDSEMQRFIEGDLDLEKEIYADMPGSYLLDDLVFRGTGLQYDD